MQDELPKQNRLISGPAVNIRNSVYLTEGWHAAAFWAAISVTEDNFYWRR